MISNEEKYKHRYIHLVTDNHENLYFDVSGFIKRVSSSYELYLYDVQSRIEKSASTKIWIIFTSIIDEKSSINKNEDRAV